MSTLIRIPCAASEIVLAAGGAGAPRIVHWGGPLGEDADDLLLQRARPHGLFDQGEPIPLFADPASGWAGAAHVEVEGIDRAKAWRAEPGDGPPFRYVHPSGLVAEISLAPRHGDVFALSTRLKAEGCEPPACRRLMAGALPLPPGVAEVMSLTGQWSGEFQRRWTALGPTGLNLESRGGLRAAHAVTPFLAFKSATTGEDQGEAAAVHLAWPGDWRLAVERSREGAYRVFGEALAPFAWTEGKDGGWILDTPELVFAWSGAGLNGLRVAFQDAARATVLAPRGGPPKAQLNTWEAVYFDHRLDRLTAIADAAADLGVERFVLDDGWFGRRTGDDRGLGDWTPRPDAYPDGLTPLIDHVAAAGLDFGLWVEPEMASADSALLEAHPDWIVGEADQPLGRGQYALDLTKPDCFAHLQDTLTGLLSDPRVAAVKWDANRDVPAGPPGLAAASLALKETVLTARADAGAPLALEACGSGGTRADWAWMAGCARCWISDAHDPELKLEALQGASFLLPPEALGAHVGAETSHLTGRRSSLRLRAAVAMLGGFGLELDPTTLSEGDRALLKEMVAAWKDRRGWLGGGHLLALAHEGLGAQPAGVFSADRRRALILVAPVAQSERAAPPPLRIAHLAQGVYRVAALFPHPALALAAKAQPAWLDAPVRASARALAAAGLPMPVLRPGQSVLIDISPDAPDEKES